MSGNRTAPQDRAEGVRIRVLCFSHVRQALGTGELDLTLPAGATASDVVERVRTLADEGLAGIPLRVAVNGEFRGEAVPLRDGDEVAIIPPVQGG